MSAPLYARLARFEIHRIRRGKTIESFRPALDRIVRDEVRFLVGAMKDDARRFGDSIKFARAEAIA